MPESKALQKAREAIARRNNPPEKPKKERVWGKNYTRVKKPTETVRYQKTEAKIKELEKQLNAAQTQLTNIETFMEKRKNIIPMFVALRVVDEQIKQEHGLQVLDLYVLAQADLEDLPMTTEKYDVYAFNRLIKAGFMRCMIVKGHKNYFIINAGKYFLNNLSKEIKEALLPVLIQTKK